MKDWSEICKQGEFWLTKVKIVDPEAGRIFEGAVKVDGGLIAEVREGAFAGEGKILDGEGLHLAPGLIDLHVHLREPGYEEKETVQTGAMSAARGGVTTLCSMPNTNPICDDGSKVAFIRARARQAGLCRVLPVGAITRGSDGKQLADLGEMHDEGAIAFSDDGWPVADAGIMRRAMELSRAWDLLIMSHSEEASLSRGGQMHEGSVSSRLGLEGIPRESEEIAVEREVRLAKMTGAKLHICHISSGGSVDIIRRAKAEGLRVTGETTPHYLLLDHSHVSTYDSHKKMNPPLREKIDQEALVQGLIDGTLDAVATDHAPHTEIEKNVEFAYAPFGVTGLETSLSAVITRLVEPGLLDLPAAVALMSSKPAAIIGVEQGRLVAGAPADLVLFDPTERWTVRGKETASRSDNTPFEGMELTGRVRATFLAGRPVFRRYEEDGESRESFTPNLAKEAAIA
ncbi:dihydroorotase [bacterium]|nr:dihydroorotase [bacterium]